MSDANPALCQLIDILTWSDDAIAVRCAIDEAYADRLEHFAAEVIDLGRTAGDLHLQQLNDDLDAISPIDRRYFWTSPHIAYDLVRTRSEDSDEAARRKRRLARSARALRNHKNGYTVQNEELPRGGAELIGDDAVNISVVTHTLLDVPEMDRGGDNLSVLDDQALALAHQRLRKSLGVISALENPALSSFVTEETHLLHMLAEDDDADVFSSGSFRYFAGWSLLFNPHVDEATNGRIVDAVIHEAIHGLVYKQEVITGFLIADPTLREDFIRSPWSGGRLHHDNLVQACFVWFGLFHAFRVIADRALLPEADQLCARAAKGFLQQDMPLTHPGYSENLNAAIECATAMVRNSA